MSGFDEVVYLTHDQVVDLAEELDYAAQKHLPARVAVDDGGPKISVDRGLWSPPIGSMQEPR
jgi:hypothetical protein